MNSKWDKYLFGINQMRIVGKDDDLSCIYCHNVITDIYCHIVDANFAGKNPMLQSKDLQQSPSMKVS